jgi:YHS domain-containing protein
MPRAAALLALLPFAFACAQAQTPLLSDFDAWESAPGIVELGSFTYDVVLLLDEAQQIDGKSELATNYGNFRYRFAGAESLRKFEANPARYAVQLDGGCGRMGALSGTGDPDRYAVHQGKLYIFASEGCRTGFLASPETILEPMLDPLVVGGEDEALLAQGLLDGMLNWMGGAEVVDGAELAWSLLTEVEYQDKLVRSGNDELIGPGARYRTSYHWGGETYAKEVAAGEAWSEDPRFGRWQLGYAQLRALERRSQAHLLTLLQDREHVDTLLCAEPSEVAGVEILHFASHGFAHRIGIQRETGEPLWHEYGGIGADISFGLIRDDYQRWEWVDGLRVPIAWLRSFNGEPVTSVDRGAEGWQLSLQRTSE